MPAVRRVRQVARHAVRGDRAKVQDDVRRWISSDAESFGFRRDYAVPHAPPEESVPNLRIAPLDKTLARKLFDEPTLDGQDQLYLERRKAIWSQGFSGGYVAVDPDGRPAYLQFYIPFAELDMVRSYWGGLFPDYGSDTLLVEGAWVPPEFRGRGLMAQGMYLTSMAAKEANSEQVRYATTYVDAGNRGARVGCEAAGFALFQRRTERWRLGRQSFVFENMAPATS